MPKIFEIASKTTTPLGLAGVLLIVVFFILWQIVRTNKFPGLVKSLTPQTTNLIIWLTFALAVLAFVLAFAGYIVTTVWAPGGQASQYTGRITDNETHEPIANALVSIELDEGVPQTQATGQDGLFNVKLPKTTQTIRIRVEAKGYEVFTRRGALNRTGLEDISLTPKPPAIPGATFGFSFPSNPTVEALRISIANARHVSIRYANPKCQKALSAVSVELNGATISGTTAAEVLENARARTTARYSVKTLKEGDSYEISCN